MVAKVIFIVYHSVTMDLERARRLMHQIGTMEPIHHNFEELTPEQRFDNLKTRIESLPRYIDEERRIIVLVNFQDQTSNGSPRSYLSLKIVNYYSPHSSQDQSLELNKIEANWLMGRDVMAQEVVTPYDLKYSDPTRVLGLLEESVTAAEDRFA